MSTKVFVGNLSFKTREPDLAKFFEEVGPVKSTNIIARGPRSLGYGFVEFEKDEDAAKAVQALHKKELDGRAINVEIAKPRVPGFVPPAPAQPADGSAAAPAAAAVPAAAPAATGVPRMGGGFRGRRRRGPRPMRTFDTQAPMPAQGAEGLPIPAAVPPMGLRRSRGPRMSQPVQAPIQTQAPAPAVAAAGAQAPMPSSAPRRSRGGRRRGPGAGAAGPAVAGAGAGAGAPITPSKTTLFVANLPFVVDDEGLLEIFEGMNVKEAHVVCKPNGRSKGYGFVTFENEEDQKRALDAVDKTIVEGRDIAVRPALAPFRKSDYPPQQQPVAAPAPAVAAPESAAAAAAPAVAAPAPAAAATEVPAAP